MQKKKGKPLEAPYTYGAILATTLIIPSPKLQLPIKNKKQNN
jgi:hypothetical protein